MPDSGQEIEAKFYIRDLKRMERRLHSLGARLVQPRILETNIRFDLPDASLRSKGRVLRLRQDSAARLTYKGASQKKQGILSQEEIEFVVDNFEKAKRFLEALGYQKVIYYEKYRTTYQLNKILIMLDELPYGDFLEIEGEDRRSIHAVANKLDLEWEAAVARSYIVLFERVCKMLKLSCEDLSFANFAGTNVTADDLSVDAGDR